MKSKIMSIYTRTPLHVGSGSSVGVVDLPIIRERHTGYPVIPGSSLKGVLADLWNGEEDRNTDYTRKPDSDAEELFGVDSDPKNAKAGKLLIGESRIAAFPVRSAKAGFAWITCPMALQRLARDWGKTITLPELNDETGYAPQCLVLKNAAAVIEEYRINIKAEVPADILDLFQGLSNDSLWQGELKNHLMLVSDEMFKYFVENTCEIAQHVKIDDEKGTAAKGALFCQENVPSETMFYTVLHGCTDSILVKFEAKIKSVNGLIQVGADATTGLGWCSVSLSNM